MLLQLDHISFNLEPDHVEGWHSCLSKVVGKAHPNVYELVNVIKREEATSKLKLQQYESGAVLPARRRVREKEDYPF